MTPSFSIVVPTYRRLDSLARLLDSLKSQSRQDFELVIVDQNSDNLIDPVLLQWPASGRLRHIKQAVPNVSAARNLGFMSASATDVLFLDDDIVLEPNFCQRLLETFEQIANDTDCLCPVVTAPTGISGPDHIIPQTQQPGTSIHEISEAMSCTVLFTRQCFLVSGGFDELLFDFARTAEDQEFFLRLRRRGLKVMLDTSLVVYHAEERSGGCELRSGSYWQTRLRCAKAWAFRYRIHRGDRGRLALRDFYHLVRSSFLNRAAMRAGVTHIRREIQILVQAINASWETLRAHLGEYESINKIDHLAKYRSVAQGDSFSARRTSVVLRT